MGFALEFELGLLIENQQGFKEVVTLRFEGSLGQVALVSGKGFQGGFEQEVEGAQVGQGLAFIEMVSTPEVFYLGLIPPRLDLSLFGDDGHFIEGFVEQSDIGGIDDGAL